MTFSRTALLGVSFPAMSLRSRNGIAVSVSSFTQAVR